LIADADVLLRLHGQRSEPDGLGIDPKGAQLEKHQELQNCGSTVAITHFEENHSSTEAGAHTWAISLN
jgi:hypothetical protein